MVSFLFKNNNVSSSIRGASREIDWLVIALCEFSAYRFPLEFNTAISGSVLPTQIDEVMGLEHGWFHVEPIWNLVLILRFQLMNWLMSYTKVPNPRHQQMIMQSFFLFSWPICVVVSCSLWRRRRRGYNEIESAVNIAAASAWVGEEDGAILWKIVVEYFVGHKELWHSHGRPW